jgi:hypothetical protein
MNHHLDLYADTDADAFLKIDNDFIVCPNWLGDVLYQMTLHPGIDIFGIQPRFGPPQDPPYQWRDVEDCRWIGGIGAIRYRVFQVCRPTPNGYFGWTEFQGKHEDVRKAWLTPDMPCFSLGLIGAEPWRTLAREYIAKGWMREWADYGDGGAGYHEWFTKP